MNLLLDALPEEVSIDGACFKINSDFRHMILFELAMQDPDLSSEEAAYIGLDLFYGEEIPDDLPQAVEALMWFYRQGKEREVLDEEESEEVGTEEPVFSYDEDAPYLFAAFMSQYGINLNREELHWWEFSALFKGLHETEQIIKIIGYRNATISADMPKSEKNHIMKMKRLYKLKDHRTQEQKEADFSEALSSLFS
jgi:hypothetical protein